MSQAVDPVGRAMRIVDAVWTELRSRTRAGAAPQDMRLARLSYDAAVERSARARLLDEQCGTLDLHVLPRQLRITVEVAAWHLQRWMHEADWYWTVFDPSGTWYGPFAPTAYCGGYYLSDALSMLQQFTLIDDSDLDRYLALVADFRRVIDEFRERTAEQARRGIFMPRAQFEQAIPLLAGLKVRSLSTLAVTDERLTNVRTHRGFTAELERRIGGNIAPAFDSLSALLDSAYAARAPESVGLAQYPDGADIYAHLIRHHTTLAATPNELHALGNERMAEIREQMRITLVQERFVGTPHAYYEHANAASSWRADTPDAVADVFRRYIRRLAPKLPAYFSTVPKAQYDVEPLASALEGAMTFGYYRQPTAEKPSGAYVFNARNLMQRGLLDIGPLTYHELMPGHHLHIASELENDALHPLRVHSFFNAFNEGWAEYAATLAGEMGMYETPEERFGRLVSDSFLTARLVVDTGMNAFGWSLGRARAYMRDNTMHSTTEIDSETIRYSCDIPAQALAYKSGEPVFISLRDKLRSALGERFDIREFHATVIGNGALPLNLVAAEIDDVIARHVARPPA